MPERVGSFDQTVAIADIRFMTVFRHPKNSGVRNIFLSPFDNLVWIGIGVILLMSACVLSVAYFVKTQNGSSRISQYFTIIVGLFCQQGYHGKMSIGSSKITIITVIVFSILIYQFYSCFFIGYFLLAPPKTIRTLEQLLASNLKVSIEDLAYNHYYFKVRTTISMLECLVQFNVSLQTTNITVAQELFKQKIVPNMFGFSNVSMGIALVKRGGYAFHCDTTYGNNLILGKLNVQTMVCRVEEMEIDL